ncbi:hypothetical protein F5146DRAFT_1004021 [Armillaria mellea]|nr:hypothetical protein F5146DRAFT_1004021 [Armillaria mellea]
MPVPIIQHVPVEIFSEIFRLTYNQKDTAKSNNDLYPGPVQTTLSLNNAGFLPIQSPELPVLIVKLTFSIEAPIDANQRLGFTLKPQAARLKVFSIMTSSWEVHTSFLQALKGACFPILVEWGSIFEGADEGIIPDMAGPEDHIDIFRHINFPSLCHLSLIGAPCHWSEFRLHNLVSLNIAQMSPPFKPHPRCLERILQKNGGSLQRLSLQNSLYEDPHIYTPELFDSNCPKLPLPHIEELTLGFIAPEEITPFLSCITTSQLQKLIIRNLDSSIPKAQVLLPLLSSAVSEWLLLAGLQQVTLQHMHIGKEDVTITLQQCEDLLGVLEQEIQDDDQADDVGDNPEVDDDSETEMLDNNGSKNDEEFGWDTDFDDGAED